MIPVSSIISMTALFQAVKHHRAIQQRNMAAVAEGGLNAVREQASRESNLARMRQQTKTRMALSMGVSPMMMGGETGAADPTMASYITQSAQRQMGRY
jgi:hypothetical protein